MVPDDYGVERISTNPDVWEGTIDSQQSVTVGVAAALAEAKGCPVEELPMLYDTIDCEKLDALLATEGMKATFEHAGCLVELWGNGDIRVEKDGTVTPP